MDNFIKQVIEEKFASKKQAKYFYAKSNDMTLSKKERAKWKRMAKEFSDKTDFKKLPTEVDEIVDDNGDFISGDEPGNPNGFIRSKKTTDQGTKERMGQMGSFGILGGVTNGNKTLRYWAESDISKGIGADELLKDPKMNYDDATDHFENDLDVPEDEAKERAEKMGFDKELPDGKIRLIENPKKYIEEYLAQRAKNSDLVKKEIPESGKKNINPIIRKQLGSIKQTLKDNGLTIKDITEYLEDNE